MGIQHRRISDPIPVAITASETTTTAIPIGDYAGGALFVSAATGTSVSYYGGYDTAVAFLPIYDRTATTPVAITQVIAATRAFMIPVECFGFPYIKLVGNDVATAKITMKT